MATKSVSSVLNDLTETSKDGEEEIRTAAVLGGARTDRV